MFCVYVFVFSSRINPLREGFLCHFTVISFAFSVPSRGPALPNGCLLAVEGKAMGIPKETGTARDPPAVLPVAKRTVKGKGHLPAGSCCSDVV